jgi:hypothetical protein
MENNNNEMYNLMGAYVSGSMMINHLSCIKASLGASKADRQLYNRMRAAEKEVKSLLKPVELHIKSMGGEDDVQNMIASVHELIDPIITPNV